MGSSSSAPFSQSSRCASNVSGSALLASGSASSASKTLSVGYGPLASIASSVGLSGSWRSRRTHRNERYWGHKGPGGVDVEDDHLEEVNAGSPWKIHFPILGITLQQHSMPIPTLLALMPSAVSKIVAVEQGHPPEHKLVKGDMDSKLVKVAVFRETGIFRQNSGLHRYAIIELQNGRYVTFDRTTTEDSWNLVETVHDAHAMHSAGFLRPDMSPAEMTQPWRRGRGTLRSCMDGVFEHASPYDLMSSNCGDFAKHVYQKCSA
jgi:hypothetical protein